MESSPLTTRREFLQRGLTLVSAGATVPLWLGHTARAVADQAPGHGQRVLVVLELSGGNDGLNTLIPYADDAYYRARPSLAIRPDQGLHKLDGHHALNPRLAQLKRRFDRGHLSVVQGVGYPNPNRSHFYSMDIWHTARTEPQRADGWWARVIEHCGGSDDPTAAIALGEQAPRSLIGASFRAISFSNAADFGWKAAGQRPGFGDQYKALNQPQGEADSTVDFLSRLATRTNASTDRVRKAVSRFRPRGRYQGRLGRDLQSVAGMIAGGLDTRIYYVRQGGFDTHAGQRGRHDNLLAQLATNLEAFQTDVDAAGQGPRVVLMAFSEFGRRVAENAGAGTDHGAAGPMLLLGQGVKGGLHGKTPSLTDLDRGDLRWTTDFRSVYATLVRDWLGGRPEALLGRDYPTLKLV